MKPTRRDLLALGGGAVAGAVFTPVPWKLLDDVAIWTQNWPWIPQPPRGPVDVKHTVCTLCGNGCGMKVRLAAGSPVGVAGVATHPVSRGALCPLAFGAHQLNWHPRRLRRVLHRGHAETWQSAVTAFRKACDEGPVAIVDGRPGRAASSTYKQFAEAHGGSYYVARSAEEKALAPYQQWTGVPAGALGYDLANTRTIVSFGAPLLDGWSTPGRFTSLWAERAAGQDEPLLRVIQVEPSLSRTASCAWRWVAIRPGSEAALAAGLARVLVEERLVAAQGPLPAVTRQEAAQQAGISVDALASLARTMVERGPSLVIAGTGDPAIAALNVVLGAVGARGGIIVRRQQHAKPLAPVEQMRGSFRAVLIDAMVPWEVAPPVDGEVFRFAAWDGGGSEADWLLPSPGFLEEFTDVPTAPGMAVETYAIAAKLANRPDAVHSPFEEHAHNGAARRPGNRAGSSTLGGAARALCASEFLAMCDPAVTTVEAAIQARCETIFAPREGVVCGSERIAVANIESAAALQEALLGGAVWMGEPPSQSEPQKELRCELKEWPEARRQSPEPDWTDSWAPPVLPPLASKLYSESRLREQPTRRIA